jgi:hypothetical protein
VKNTITPCPNPFGVAYPPKWWLNEMWLFDDQLVIFPSQKAQTFILARRATRSKGESPHDVKGVSQNPDTILMSRHRLVRVCEILPGVIWDNRVFQRLAAHDIQRLGGHKEVSLKLEAMDRQREDRINRRLEADGDAIARDAYKGMKYKIGERISLTPSGKHGRGDLHKKPVSVHVQKPSIPPAPRIVLAT